MVCFFLFLLVRFGVVLFASLRSRVIMTLNDLYCVHFLPEVKVK